MQHPTREPFLAHLLVHAAMLRRHHATELGAAKRLEEHAHALDLLADLVRARPEDDERLLLLGTRSCVAVSSHRAQPASMLTQFAGTSCEACDTFLTGLVRIARDDALARVLLQQCGPGRLTVEG
jgi:hypothetical protein